MWPTCTLPDDLTALPPGPGLGVALASIDPLRVSGSDAVEVLRATRRQENAARAATLAAVVEVAVRQADSAETVQRMLKPDRYSADEIRAALALSVPGSEKLLDLAWAVVRRLPQLHAAMAAGDLDEQRAWAFTRWTELLSDAHAHAVVGELLPLCSPLADEPLPTGKLIDAIKKLAIALDPDWAERTFTAAVRRRRVIAYPNPDGTADLTGTQLALDRVAAACGRIDALAKAAKGEGDPRPIDHLRADLYLGMLDGTYAACTDEAILAALAEGIEAVAHTEPGPNPEPAASPAGGFTDSIRSASASGETQPDTPESAGSIPQGGGVRPAPAVSPGADPPAPPQPRHAGVQLRVRLSTLLGLDRLPAEMPGWGAVHAEHARAVARLMGSAQWRFAITDHAGYPITTGLASTRPAGYRARNASNRGLVDLLVPAQLLTDLLTGPLRNTHLADPATIGDWLPVLRELADRLAHPHALPDDSHRRFPGSALRRLIELTKPTCVGVGCRRPARAADMDHTLDHAKGGTTTGINLAPGCGHDHDLKTKGGWALHRKGEHSYRWVTRLGREYLVAVKPAVEPLPDPDPFLDSGGNVWNVSRIWANRPPPEPPAPPPPRRLSLIELIAGCSSRPTSDAVDAPF